MNFRRESRWRNRVLSAAGLQRSAFEETPREEATLEQLEPRVLLAVVTWTGAAGDNLWHTPGNWSGGVPTINDDAIIPDVAGTPTISLTAASGARAVRSLDSLEAVTISGGSLRIDTTWTLRAAALLAGGTLIEGTLESSGGALALGPSGGTLDGITINGDLGMTTFRAHATILNGLTLNGAALLGNEARLLFSGSQTLGGAGTVVFQNQPRNALTLSQTGTTLTVGPGVTIRSEGGQIYAAQIGYSDWLGGGNNTSLVLQGVIEATTPGSSISLLPRGTGTLTNTGQITVTDATLNLGGNFSIAALGTLTRSGGTVNLLGTLQNTGATLNLDAASGSWNLVGGGILGGTVNQSDGSRLLLGPQSGTLDGVTIHGGLDLTTYRAHATVLNGLMLHGTALLGNEARLYFNGNQTLGGAGTVIFQNQPRNALILNQNTTTLTVGPGITIRSEGSQPYAAHLGYSEWWGGGNNTSLVLQGTIEATTPGSAISLLPRGTGTLTNTGQITITGSTLTLGGNFTVASMGTVVRSGGVVNLIGTLNNTGTNLALDAASGSWNLLGGGIVGGTVTQTGGSLLILTTSSGTLDGVTIHGGLDLTTYRAHATVLNGLTLYGTALLGSEARLYFSGSQTLGGAGTVVFQNQPRNALVLSQNTTTLTVGPGVTIRSEGGQQHAAQIGHSDWWGGGNNTSLVLQGVIEATTPGSSISLLPRGTGTLTNTGQITITGATLSLGGNFSVASLGTLTRSGGTVNLLGMLQNTGATLNLDAASGSWNLLGGGIIGGTVTQTGGSLLHLTASSGTLDGVTIHGGLDLTTYRAHATVLNSLTLHGTALLGNEARLYFSGTQTLGGTATFIFQNQPRNGLVVNLNTTTLTVGPEITIRSESGQPSAAQIGYHDWWGGGNNTSLVLQGTIEATSPGSSISLLPRGTGTLTNTGQITITDSTLSLGGNFTPTSLGSVVRSGGAVNLVGTLNNTGATLALDAASGSWSMLGGAIIGGAVTQTGGSLLIFTASGGTLDGVTVHGGLDMTTFRAHATVLNGLTLHGTALLGSEARLLFSGTQTLGGAGTIVFQNQPRNGLVLSQHNTILTVGPGVTIRSEGGQPYAAQIGYHEWWSGGNNISLVLQGVVQSTAAGGVIGLHARGTGTLTNTGQITVADSTISLLGNMTPASLGAFSRSNAHVILGGTLTNAGSVLTLTAASGPWTLSNGSIIGGTVNQTSPGLLRATSSGGTLDNVTLLGELLLDANSATFYLTSNTTFTVARLRANAATLIIEGGTTITGLISIEGAAAGNRNVYIGFSNGLPTTIAPQGVIRLASDSGGNLSLQPFIGSSLINHGLISSEATGRTFTLSFTTVTNHGTIQTTAGIITISASSSTSTGTLRATGGGQLTFTGPVVVDGANLLVTGTNSTLTIRGGISGNTANRDLVAGPGTLVLSASSSPTNPQLLEVMSRDLGPGPAAFTRNFVYGTVQLAFNTYVRLVDVSDNSAGADPEALYVNSLIVPSGATLDLNGLRLYTRAAQITGTVINGVIEQVPDSGPVIAAAPAPGTISIAGELDEWTFFGRLGRAVSIVVNPGLSGPNPALPPQLRRVQVSLLDAGGTVLGAVSSTADNQTVTLPDVTIPSDGTYRIHIRAAASHASYTGNYTVALWDVTTDAAPVALNQLTFGAIENPFGIDRWEFNAAAGQQIRFDLLSATAGGLTFSLTGPNGYQGFTGIAGDSELLTLPTSGAYRLRVAAPGGGTGQYSFRINETTLFELPVGEALTRSNPGPDSAQLFRVQLADPGPLLLRLDDAADANRNELYIRFGAPPTRAVYDYRYDQAASADHTVLVPSAQIGDWYILVYGRTVPQPSTFTLEAVASQTVVTSVTPDRGGAGSHITMTIRGAGFDAATIVDLVFDATTSFRLAMAEIDSYSQITATFAALGMPEGVYDLRVSRPGGPSDTLPNVFTILPPGPSTLETRLIMPPTLGRHAVATLYVEYANTGSAAMPAPLLQLQSADPDGSDRPILTLDQSRVTSGFWTAGLPSGFSHTIQILASGATPGVLNPGERITLPVYYTGLLQPWNFSDTAVELEIRTFEAGNADPVPWDQMQEQLRPASVQPEAWTAVYANLISSIGQSWGQFVQMLSENARFLSQLGQHVVDVGQLYNFEVAQAIGLNPLRTLASAVDATITTPGGDLAFGRLYQLALDQRFESSIFGRGWATPWLDTLTVDAAGTVEIAGSTGVRRRFQPDTRFTNAYFALPGDTGVLRRVSTDIYELREQSGTLIRFDAQGRIDWTEDANANRVTLGYADGRLATLTHSSGASLTLAYNPAGLLASVTDSAGRATTYGYDAQNQYLLTATGHDGLTTTYTYDTTPNSPRQHALLSVQSPGDARHYQYDARGRLAATFRPGDVERVGFAYNSTGRVTTSDVAGGSASFDYDHRALLGRVVDAFGNVTTTEYGADRRLARVIDPLGQSLAFAWCDCGSLASFTDELGNTTRFTYANVGPGGTVQRMTSFTDARGNVVQYTYDTRGNLLSTIYPDQSVELAGGHDPAGNPLSLINRRGQSLFYAYNAAGQVTRQTFHDGSYIDLTYDARGNLLTATEQPADLLTTFDYDDADRLTRVTYPGGRFLDFTYDAAGRRASMTDQDGFEVTYAYDAVGRLHRLTDGQNTTLVEYDYDAVGRLARKDNGNGTYTEYQYDAAGQILSIANHAPGGAINSRFDYTYDALGRRDSMMTTDGLWSYTYDAASQLTRAVFTPSSGSPIPTQDLRYVYDAAGNRIRTIENGVTTEYSTNALNQYTQVGGDVLVYDADGNLLSRSGPSGNAAYTYDQLSRLVRVVTPDGTWEYDYDALGNRVASTLDGARTDYVLDPTGLGDVVAEYASVGTLVARYVHGAGLVGRIDGGGARSFFDFDAIGSAAGLTGAAGILANEYAYSPFGAILFNAGSIENSFAFVGQYGVMSDADDLQFMRGRHMSPLTGRFMTPDSLQLGSAQVNWYSYTGNSPIGFVDVTGAFVTAPLAAAGAAIGGILGAGYYGITWAATGNGSLQGLGGATVGGAVTGGILGATGGAGAWGFIAGSTGGAVGYIAGTAGTGSFSMGGLVANTGVGGITGLLPLRPFGGFKPGGRWGSGAPQFPNTLGGSNKHGLALWGNTNLTTGIAALVSPFLPGGQAGGSGGVGTSTSIDPNALYGPDGFGPENFIAADATVPYRIEYENYGPGSVDEDGEPVSPDRWASAPAQRVVVTNTLSPSLDLSTFRLTGFGWGDVNISIPTPAQSWQQVVSMTYNGQTFEVWFDAAIDYETRELRAVFQSINPATTLPPDVLTGFLPPEDGTGRGMGFLTYLIRPVAALPTGTEIRNIALIQFDGQTFIATNQVDPLDPSLGTDPEKEALVTLDGEAPESAVVPFPSPLRTERFTVRWSGQDPQGGSGLARYSVFVSKNGGAFEPWLTRTEQTEAVYAGRFGITYAFYSIAADNVGNTEAPPAAPDAQVRLLPQPPSLASIIVNEGQAQRSMVTSIRLVFSATVQFLPGGITLMHERLGPIGFTLASVGLGGREFLLTFQGAPYLGGSLPDGTYNLRLDSHLVQDPYGQPLTGSRETRFHRLFGDTDGDRDVDQLDRAVLFPPASPWGRPSQSPVFDYDGDGDVDALDLQQFWARYKPVH